jgi:hypothetical protein
VFGHYSLGNSRIYLYTDKNIKSLFYISIYLGTFTSRELQYLFHNPSGQENSGKIIREIVDLKENTCETLEKRFTNDKFLR